MLNACWVPSIDSNYHCFYPAAVDEIQINAQASMFNSFPSQYEMFGQPICRPFNSGCAKDYLNSYYQCKQAGCATDSSITSRSIYDQFLNLLYTNEVPENLRYSFWLGIEQGKITPGNYEKKLNEMKSSQNCQELSGFLALSNLAQNEAFEFSTGFYKSVIEPLKRNLLQSSVVQSGSNQLTQLQCLLITSQAIGGNLSPFLKQLFDGFCAEFGKSHFECPYSPSNINLTGYPVLTGSVEGCCEKHQCYIPRREMLEQRSGVAAFYSEWGEWESCSATCGGGTKKRTRTCEKHPQDFSFTCQGKNQETESCNSQLCPYWSSWGELGSCSTTCGNGFKTRTRVCVNSQLQGVECDGNSEESFPCRIRSCPVYGEWMNLTECPCESPQVQIRYRSCVRDCEGVEDGQEDTHPCIRYCGKLACTSERSCFYPICRQRFTCVCQPEGYLCDEELPPPERCYTGFCRFF